MEFDFDGWPSIHDCDEEGVRPYNGSLFDLRDSYRKCFPEEDYRPLDMATAKGKLSKIRYTVNLLPQFFFGHVDSGDDDGNLWDELRDDNPTITGSPDEDGNWPEGHDKIDYFTAAPIEQLIEFKWSNGTFSQILFNFSLHCLYIFVVADYICEVFVREQHGEEDVYSKSYMKTLVLDTEEYTIAMGAFLIYPLMYESVQLRLAGFADYFGDPYNYADLVNIFGGLSHIIISNSNGPINFPSRITLLVAFLASTFKFFMLLRVFASVAPVVAILRQSIYDLRYFLLILVLIVFIIGLTAAVLGLDNRGRPGSGLNADFGGLTLGEAIDEGIPNPEFVKIHSLASYFLVVFNVATGNFIMSSSLTTIEVPMQRFFWLLWLFAVILIAVVFLNFVVAKAMASHAEATERMEAVVNKEKADMIDEVEAIAIERFTAPEQNPRFIVAREVDV
jgi:hypothetical protein